MSGNTEKDLSLIRQAIEGESSAFGSLYDRYHEAIYRFIYLKVGHREEVEDLTHHVFLSAWQHMNSFKDQGLPFSSWLYQIARNKVIDYYRTKKFNLSLEDFDIEDIGDKVDEENNLENRMDMEEARKALLELTEEQQNVIIMRFVEDLSYKEISKNIGKSQGTIRVIQYRALKNLQKIINRYETDGFDKNIK